MNEFHASKMRISFFLFFFFFVYVCMFVFSFFPPVGPPPRGVIRVQYSTVGPLYEEKGTRRGKGGIPWGNTDEWDSLPSTHTHTHTRHNSTNQFNTYISYIYSTVDEYWSWSRPVPVLYQCTTRTRIIYLFFLTIIAHNLMSELRSIQYTDSVYVIKIIIG